MRADVRERIRVLYEHRCGYYGVRESRCRSASHAGYFCPRSLGGNDEVDNLVYCCHGCNEFKGDYWHEAEELRLFHPLRDDMATHFTGTLGGRLRALTERGANHIQRLRLNRPELISFVFSDRMKSRLSRRTSKSLHCSKLCSKIMRRCANELLYENHLESEISSPAMRTSRPTQSGEMKIKGRTNRYWLGL